MDLDKIVNDFYQEFYKIAKEEGDLKAGVFVFSTFDAYYWKGEFYVVDEIIKNLDMTKCEHPLFLSFRVATYRVASELKERENMINRLKARFKEMGYDLPLK